VVYPHGGWSREPSVGRPARGWVMRGGLSRRVSLASGVLVLLIAGAFSMLFLAITDLRHVSLLASDSQQVMAVANRLERLVLDIETGQRGYLVTHNQRFLEPWEAARQSIPGVSERLVRLGAGAPRQKALARRITAAVSSYVRAYSIPLVDAARVNRPYATSEAAADEGKRRVDAIRAHFDAFIGAERELAARRRAASDSAARRAVVSAAAGLGGSILLILLFAAYLLRAVAGPVRRTAAVAGRLAEGDLSTRLPEKETAEVGALERAFNSMARSLEDNRDRLIQRALEQAALRNVATLVAQGRSSDDVFAAVAAQLGLVLQADFAHIMQFMSDETVRVIASWSESGDALPLGSRWPLEGHDVSSIVWRTREPTRFHGNAEVSGEVGIVMSELGVRSSVGSPIVVDGRLWGAMIASSRERNGLPPDAGTRLSAFTEIVATAISNAQAHADLAASRARIVAAADETRRRVERDLHDGTQQRLLSLALQLRAIEASVPPGGEELRDALSRVTSELQSAMDDLREFAHGIHPAILSEGGLAPALRALGRRSPIPVEVEAHIPGRLPEHVEIAAYFVASEAITNAVKHSGASLLLVHVREENGRLRLSIRDDGAGGADPARGSGLTGLADRVEALGGSLTIESPAGEGTALLVELPLRTQFSG
jgi:signal transduction histidine kinase